MIKSLSFVLLLAIVACANSDYSSMSSYDLWLIQRTTVSQTQLAIVEAELGVRGEKSFGYSYLGDRSSLKFGQSLFARNTAPTDLKNCSDFANSAAAQKYFLQAGGPTYDPHGLDRDGDGLACEWGTHIQRIAQSRTTVRPRRTKSYSRCYTGPRGGTYTITASGAKDYNGC